MALIPDQAIVLRRLDYSESSQVLVMFTRHHGKVRAIAKGIKRSTKTRFAAAIDLLDVGDLVVSVRSARQQALATLTDWKQSQSLVALRQSLARLYAGQYAAEITAGLTGDWDPHEELFEALLRLLTDLCALDEPLPAVVAFVTGLLVAVGSAPHFEFCVGCNRPVDASQVVHFSSLEGGLLCRDCEAAHVEKREVAPRLHVLQGAKLPDPAVCRPVFDLLNYHISHLMGRKPLLADALAAALGHR